MLQQPPDRSLISAAKHAQIVSREKSPRVEQTQKRHASSCVRETIALKAVAVSRRSRSIQCRTAVKDGDEERAVQLLQQLGVSKVCQEAPYPLRELLHDAVNNKLLKVLGALADRMCGSDDFLFDAIALFGAADLNILLRHLSASVRCNDDSLFAFFLRRHALPMDTRVLCTLVQHSAGTASDVTTALPRRRLFRRCAKDLRVALRNARTHLAHCARAVQVSAEQTLRRDCHWLAQCVVTYVGDTAFLDAIEAVLYKKARVPARTARAFPSHGMT
ncbi:MAG: hypothetical protein MHM6MM_001000 [Cercozoa sp. M6MM]